MKIKFQGSLHELQTILETSRMYGRWERQPNRVHMMRTSSGANLHWAETTGSIWFDGPAQKAILFATLVNAIFDCEIQPGLKRIDVSPRS